MKKSLLLPLALAFLGLCCFFSAPAPAADAVNQESLQGAWRGERFDSGTGDGSAKGVQLELNFTGNRVKGLRLPQGDIGEGEFTISKDGKAIDTVGTSGGFKGNTYLGIIKIEGDTLYWSTTAGGGKTQKRPADFSGDPAQRVYLIVVKRQKS